jgi:hypothetical protein
MAVFLLIILTAPVAAQNLEGYSFQSINVPANARLVALGGKNVSSNDKDPTMFLSNPGTLNSGMDNNISFSYSPYFAKTNLLNATVTKDFKKWGTWGAGVKYLNYGTFEGYDPAGEFTGKFKASDYSLIITNAHFKNNFSFGASLKYAGSFIAGFSSSAILFDLGGMFIHPKKDFKIGLAINNIGFGLREYTNTADFSMPFDVQIGSSFKPEHMPLRFSITLHQLNKFRVVEEGDGESVSTGQQVLGHVVLGAEILINKNLNLRAGYNYLRRQELKDDKAGFAGFSLGAMIRIKGIEVAYGRGFFNKTSAQNCFTLIADLNYFLKNK